MKYLVFIKCLELWYEFVKIFIVYCSKLLYEIRIINLLDEYIETQVKFPIVIQHVGLNLH